MNLKITAIIIVCNEEEYVEPCLRSVIDVVDELIVCHDGPCCNRTVEIAKQFTDQVYIAEFRGACEPNVIRMLKHAKNDWILRIDCDETLSEPLIEQIKKLEETNKITHYCAIWKACYANEAIRAKKKAPADRLFLFKKTAAKGIGIPHRALVIEGEKGDIFENIEHRAKHQEYTLYELLTKKLWPFSKNDARIRVVYPLETYGIDNVATLLLKRDRLRHKYPLLVCFPLALLSFVRALIGAFKSENISIFFKALKWSVAHFAYQLFLGYYIFKAKKEKLNSSLTN
jgi:glycosyltransferase involved in cell wall biosynthesis